MLEKEFKYYQEHQKELVKKYNGKYLIIYGNKVEGAYDSHIAAYTEGKKKYKVGKFLIQHCTPGEASYTQYYYTSRVSFN
jgi:hypothetical protein